MKFIQCTISVSIILSVFISCTHSENEALLLGQWKGVEWLIEGNPSDYSPEEVYFSFTKDGYSSDFGGEKESGTYYLRENDLYTTPENQMEIMVQIAKLTKDSLVFQMNRSGKAETLTLIRNM